MYPSTGDFTNRQQLEIWILAGGHKPYLNSDPALKKLIDLIEEKVSVEKWENAHFRPCPPVRN